MFYQRSGFTVLELSVVLVIIGLLIAGVLVGQDMLRQSRIQSVVVDIKNFRSAISLFQEQYNDLPGDITDAFDYWDTDCAATAAACNGDGDGAIEEDDDAADTKEALKLWQQLVLAKQMPGNYTGVDAGVPDVQIEVNAPPSKIPEGGYLPVNATVYTETDNFIAFGSERNDAVEGEVVNALEAWQIDNKMDDGKAAEGGVLTLDGSGETGCIDTLPNPDIYDQDNEDIKCRMFFKIY